MDVEATVMAIGILRNLASYGECVSVGQHIRTSAYLRLEKELRAYLTAGKGEGQ